MKKNLLLTVLCAICALAITFVACKKEEETTAKNKPLKALALDQRGIYNDFEPGLYAIDEGYVKSHNSVVIRTTFNNGHVWVERRLGDDGITQVGGDNSNVYDIYINKDGKEYSTFCGAYISSGFGQSDDYQSATLEPVKNAQIISALNYINDTYGSLNTWVECIDPRPERTPVNATKVIGQCVIWKILDYIGADGNLVQPQNGIKSVYPEYANPGYYDYGTYLGKGFEAAIDDAYAAALAGYTGREMVTGLAYLVGPNYPNDISSWQPQIVPLGGKTPVMGPSVGTVTAIAQSDYIKWGGQFDKKNNPINIEKIVANSNHFTCVVANTAKLMQGIDIYFVVGNKVDIVGTGNVKLVNGEIVLTIDDYAKGDFGLVAFTNWAGIPKNGNIHSINKIGDMMTLGAAAGVARFDHDKKLVVPCPVAASVMTPIFLYFHAGAMNFWL